MGPARESLHQLLHEAIANRSSDAYAMLEVICLNHLIESDLKTREYDALELLRVRNEGKELSVKQAQSQVHIKHLATQTEKVGLENRLLQHDIGQIKKELQQAEAAKTGGKPFDYERALNQISAVVGLRGPEKFRFEKEAPQAS